MWSELPQDVLARIFMCLSMVDLVLGTSRTCRSWRSASKNPAIWNTVDVNALKPRITNRPHMGFLKCALKLSCGAISCLIFDFDDQVMAYNLVYIALRTPRLKRLLLPMISSKNLHGFLKAVKHWKDLESVALQRVERNTVIVKALGENCKKLTHLKLVTWLEFGLAEAICSHLPQLKTLSLRYAVAYKEALLDILRTLKGLEVLNLSHLLLLDIVPPGRGGLKISLCKEPGDVMAVASKVKGFVGCRSGLCERCDGRNNCQLEIINWQEMRWESWRFDEAPEFRI